MRPTASPLTLLLAIAAGSPLLGCPSAPPDDDPTPAPPPDFCEGRAEYHYAPSPDRPLTTFPDDHFTRPDPSTATGLRVAMEPDTTPAVADFPEGYIGVFDELSTLDGWGTTAGIVFRFNFALDAASLTEDAVGLVAFTPEGPVRVAVDVAVSDFNSLVVLTPRVPLPPATPCAAAIFAPARSSDGSCVRPGDALRALLSPATEVDGPAPALSPRFLEATAAFGKEITDIAAMTVFTTQSTQALSLAVAADIAARAAPGWTSPWTCAPDGPDSTLCQSSLDVADYRVDGRVIPADSDGSPFATYSLGVSLWLPGDGNAGPYPLALYGHGLGGDRGQGGSAARLLAPEGIAVVAIDAVEHGDHPGRSTLPLPALDPLTFFAISVDPPGIRGLELRDNFRQSTFDKLQLLRALGADPPDVDDDGVADVVTDGMLYVGISLGGLMGPELLALSDAFRGALLSVAGGRVTSIIAEGELFAIVIDIMRPPGTPDSDVDRFFPVLQTLVDPGDPMVWAPHMTGTRLVPAERFGRPQTLLQFALNDGIVPNVANAAVARASGLPGVGAAVFPIADLEFGPGPVVGNLEDGGSGGIQLFDVITERETPGQNPEPASHDNVTTSHEGWTAGTAFLLPVLDGEPGVVVDPYAAGSQ